MTTDATKPTGSEALGAPSGPARAGSAPDATRSPTPESGPSGTATYEPAPSQSRSFLQQTLRDTFSRPGARLGLIWIAVLATVGVFAPFLANSEPILVKQGGRVTMPIFQSLRPPDVMLTAMYIVAVVLLAWRRFSIGRSIMIIAVAGALAAVPSFVLLQSRDAPVYERWRQLETDGKLDWIVRTIVPYSPNDRMNELTTDKLHGPTRQHWLGTSIFGEDVLSRMMHASRVALTIGLLSTGIAATIGVIVGGIMGYFAGVFDLLMMRGLEILEAIPRLILLVIVTVFIGRNLYLMMAVIGFMSWTADARFVRAEFLRLRNQDFVHAARALGLPLRTIIFRHMLPNGISPVLVNASFGVAGAILLESTLSFLGLGLGAEDPSWGQLLNQARSGGTGFNWWIAAFPGAAIFLTVFSYVLIGEAMRDALDPKLRKRD